MNVGGPWPPRVQVHLRRDPGGRSALWRVQLAVAVARTWLVLLAVLAASGIPSAATATQPWLALTAVFLAGGAMVPVDATEDEP